MNEEIEKARSILRREIEVMRTLVALQEEINALKARVALLEAVKDKALKDCQIENEKLRPLDNGRFPPLELIPPRWPSPYEYAPSPAPTWWPFTGPTCIDTTAAHEAPPSDPSPACPSPLPRPARAGEPDGLA